MTADRHWPGARRFSLLPLRPGAWTLLIQTDRGMHRFDLKAEALAELLENGRKALDGQPIGHTRIDALDGRPFPDPAEK